jgi:hypothetical protein
MSWRPAGTKSVEEREKREEREERLTEIFFSLIFCFQKNCKLGFTRKIMIRLFIFIFQDQMSLFRHCPKEQGGESWCLQLLILSLKLS